MVEAVIDDTVAVSNHKLVAVLQSAEAFVDGALSLTSTSSHAYMDKAHAFVWEVDNVDNSGIVDGSLSRRIVHTSFISDVIPPPEAPPSASPKKAYSKPSFSSVLSKFSLVLSDDGEEEDVPPARHDHGDTTQADAVLHAGDMCWLCGSWRQVEFRWNPPVSGPIANTSVSVRASFDDWASVPLAPQPDGTWMVARMVPSVRVFFVFDVDGVSRIAEDEMFEPTMLGMDYARQVWLLCTTPMVTH